jgi:hypothetical protein
MILTAISAIAAIKNLIDIASKIKGKKISDVKSDKNGNINVTIKVEGKKDSNVVVTVPVNLYTNAIPYTKELANLAKENYNKENFYYTRSDILPSIAENQIPAGEYDKIIEKIRPYLKKSRLYDLIALHHAATICRLEDSNAPEEEVATYRSLLKTSRNYTLYNWLRCGDVFNEEILPQMNVCLTITGRDDISNFEKLFLPFWDNRLSFHPTKVFVSHWKSKRELFLDIKTRLLDNQVNEIKIYTRKSRNKFAENIIKNFIQKNDNFDFNIKSYKLGPTDARTFTIKRK